MRVDPTNPFWDWIALLGAGPDDCWLYMGWPGSHGHALTSNPEGGRRQVYAHRLAFKLANGYWAVEVSHTCHTPTCCNPAHLVDESHAENLRRSAEDGRFPRGERWHAAHSSSSPPPTP